LTGAVTSSRTAIALLLIALVMTPAAAASGWYLLVPSDAQMMADGSVAKGVTVTQYPQAAAFDTAEACERTRDAWANKALAAATKANKARFSYDDGRPKDPKKEEELRDALQKAQVTYLEAMIRLHEMQHSVCVVSDDPRLREPGR